MIALYRIDSSGFIAFESKTLVPKLIVEFFETKIRLMFYFFYSAVPYYGCLASNRFNSVSVAVVSLQYYQ